MRQRTADSLRLAAAMAVIALLLPGASGAESAAAPEPAPKASLFKGEEVGAQLSDGFAKGFDAVLLRPLGAIKTGVGVALFVPASLLSAFDGLDATKEGWQILVEEPAKETFQRPLGDF